MVKPFKLTQQEQLCFETGIYNLPRDVEIKILYRIYKAQKPLSLKDLYGDLHYSRTNMFYILTSMRDRNMVTLYKRKYKLTPKQRDFVTCVLTAIIKFGLMFYHYQRNWNEL